MPLPLLRSKHARLTITRIHLQIPISYRGEPVISRLISEFGLSVNITGAMAGSNTDERGYFDLELRGTVQQINHGLSFLESLDLTVVGKPNAHEDEWHY